ncbi:Glycine dehydrogenase [decarboxylating] [Pantoea agglomerans]|uniref:Glycine dehydrogenase [decarboxylating] n=1 Tax=Enterobacter agglomerans TaxID=549 RepID=A0A379ABD7_ENTAG|nr:Glycine dehydrogenase [decarboxylating] [Pantoea agglomerans]
MVRTRAETFGFELIIDSADKAPDHDDLFGVLLQQVGTTGEAHDYSALIAGLKARKVVVSVAADFMSLVLLGSARQTGCRHCLWFSSALRRANGLRRPSRGLFRQPRRA